MSVSGPVTVPLAYISHTQSSFAWTGVPTGDQVTPSSFGATVGAGTGAAACEAVGAAEASAGTTAASDTPRGTTTTHTAATTAAAAAASAGTYPPRPALAGPGMASPSTRFRRRCLLFT